MSQESERHVNYTAETPEETAAPPPTKKKQKRLSKMGKQVGTNLCKKTIGAPPPNVPTKKFLMWWERPPIKYAFSLFPVRNKLEMLMGSNMVSLSDRDYMIYLQARVLDDYEKAINKRIALRQADEMERVKNLVLNGKIPLDEAPMEMANHPVMLIDQYCKRVLAERRAKMKVLRPFIPTYLYWDDTPDPPSGLSIEGGHCFRPNNECLCHRPEDFLEKEPTELIADGFMMEDEEFDKLHYETPEIKQLRTAETVQEMYDAADELLGVLAFDEDEISFEDDIKDPEEI